MCKKIIALFLCLALALFIPISAQAKTTYKYTTIKAKLRNKAAGKVLCIIPRNTKLQVLKTGKKWVKVKYNQSNYSVEKKILNSESLPNEKKSKQYIKKLRNRNPIHWRKRKYTFYTSRSFPIHKLPVPGLHLDKNGFFCDKNDYIVLGSSRINKANKKIIATPFGKYGKVYDTGGVSTPSWLCDCAVNW